MSKANSDEIILAINQNAKINECGSCFYFDRRGIVEFDNNGYCKFKLPPTREFVKQIWNGDSMPLDTVYDNQSCSFWKSSGKTYIVSQRIKP